MKIIVLLSLVKFFNDDSKLREASFVKGVNALNIIPPQVGLEGSPIAQRNYANAKNKLNEMIQLDELYKEYDKEIKEAKTEDDFKQDFSESTFKQPAIDFNFDEAQLRNLSRIAEREKQVLEGDINVKKQANDKFILLEGAGLAGTSSDAADNYIKYNKSSNVYSVAGTQTYEPLNNKTTEYYAKRNMPKIDKNIDQISASITELENKKTEIQEQTLLALDAELDETRDSIIRKNTDRKIQSIDAALLFMQNTLEKNQEDLNSYKTQFKSIYDEMDI